jgi:biopolymer transport protein ExbD
MDEEVALDDMFARVKAMIGNDPDRLVVIKADREVVLNKAVKVMDIVKAAGAGRLCLATEKGF